MTTPGDTSLSGVVDTNVLVYAHLTGTEHHAASAQLLESARSEQLHLAVTPQIILEFYAVITDPRRVTTPYSPAEAWDAIQRVLSLPGMFLLPPPADVLDQIQWLSSQKALTGHDVFDVQIVATMLEHDVKTIFTYDKALQAFDDLMVITLPQ